MMGCKSAPKAELPNERDIRCPKHGIHLGGTMKVTDPVCGMRFEQKKAVTSVEYQGRTYYFCTEACRRQFEEDPDRYLEQPA